MRRIGGLKSAIVLSSANAPGSLRIGFKFLRVNKIEVSVILSSLSLIQPVKLSKMEKCGFTK